MRLLLIVAVLGAVFLLGMSLTWPGFFNPSGFPINRRFLAVSLNGRPFNYERMLHLPTMEVRRNGETAFFACARSATADATR